MSRNSSTDEIQAIAEELAEVKHGQDYYSLTDEQQAALYEQAMQIWREDQ